MLKISIESVSWSVFLSPFLIVFLDKCVISMSIEQQMIRLQRTFISMLLETPVTLVHLMKAKLCSSLLLNYLIETIYLFLWHNLPWNFLLLKNWESVSIFKVFLKSILTIRKNRNFQVSNFLMTISSWKVIIFINFNFLWHVSDQRKLLTFSLNKYEVFSINIYV